MNLIGANLGYRSFQIGCVFADYDLFKTNILHQILHIYRVSKKRVNSEILHIIKYFSLVISFLTNMYEIFFLIDPIEKSAKLFFTQNLMSRKIKVWEYVISHTLKSETDQLSSFGENARKKLN